ncbi:hypothetical protein F9B85_03430 [Heliorestis acidaminivorans]|uniref:Uncharacterized protein n=1 Tax=Heliorestis acidaminivorans TaxID=553427 RepID=A0A6I0F2N8_9FIRM|nr:hypothetical protein F9B85_03430 [Heliorestis acidaminivorans]
MCLFLYPFFFRLGKHVFCQTKLKSIEGVFELEGINFFKGLIIGTLISVPLWALIVFFVYLVISP